MSPRLFRSSLASPFLAQLTFFGFLISFFLVAPARADLIFARPLLLEVRGESMTAAQLNRDGKTDLAVVGYDYSRDRFAIHLLESVGDGTFRTTHSIALHRGPAIARTGDANGDSRADILIGYPMQGTVAAVVNDGAGGFTLGEEQPIGGAFGWMEAGDLNWDGRADLITAKNAGFGETPATTIHVSLARPDGTYGNWVAVDTAEGPIAAAVADLNGDGANDIAVANHVAKSVSVLLNRGDGSFAPRTDLSLPAQPSSIMAVDLNRDGRIDLAVLGDGTKNAVSIFRNEGNGRFSVATDTVVGKPSEGPMIVSRSISVADFNADGAPDLIVPKERGIEKVQAQVLYNDGAGGLTTGDSIVLSPALYAQTDLLTADFTGDGYPDLVTQIYGYMGLTIHVNKPAAPVLPAARFDGPTTYPAQEEVMGVAIDDFTGDGRLDLLSTGRGSAYMSARVGNGDGTFGPEERAYLGAEAYTLHLVDLNGDGKKDLVAGLNPAPSSGSIITLISRGDGTFAPKKIIESTWGIESLAAADFDGDGKTDLAISNGAMFPESVKFLVLKGRGDGTFEPKTEYAAPNYGASALRSADLDADGDIDLIATNTSRLYVTGQDRGIVLLNRGDGTFDLQLNHPLDSSRYDPSHLADFNADGRSDLLTSPAVGDQGTRISFGTPDGGFAGGFLHPFTIRQWMGEGYAGDFNDDGRIDLWMGGLVAGYGDGTFDATTRPFAEGMRIWTADFDADGRPDLAAAPGTSSGAWGVSIFLNRTPPLSVVLSREFAAAGDRVDLPIISNRELAGVPTAAISGDCIDDGPLAVVPSGRVNGLSASYVVPAGAGNCEATVTVKGVMKAAGREETGTARIFIDRTPPTSSIVWPGDPIADGATVPYPVSVEFAAEDSGSGATSLFYALDRSDCSPAQLDSCAEVTRSGTDPFYANVYAYDDGAHSIVHFARDRAGNLEEPKRIRFIVNSTPPIVNTVNVTTEEDRPVVITLEGYDPGAGQPLVFRIEGTPNFGTVGPVVGNKVTYTPKPGFSGTDRFAFEASDGTHSSGLVDAVIEVRPVNDPPAAKDASVLATEDQPKEITVEAIDPDGDPVTLSVTTPPSHGAALVSSPSRIVYTPAPDYNGLDSFTYRASDGKLSSEVATVRVTVVAVNDAPVASDLVLATERDAPLVVRFSASDPDGNRLTYRIVERPLNGLLTPIDGDRLTYVPNRLFRGTDRFTYMANDSQLNSNLAVVRIQVGPPLNTPPVARDAAVVVVIDTPRSIRLDVADEEGDPLRITLLAMPEHGTLRGDGLDLVYTPAPGYSGSDRFTYRASDGQAESVIAIVSISVLPPLLVIGDATLVPGRPVVVPVTLAKAAGAAAGLDLTLRVLGPSDGETAMVRLAPGRDAGKAEVEADSPNRILLALPSAITGPAEWATASVALLRETPEGSGIRLEVERAVVSSEAGVETDITERSRPGTVLVGACVETRKGDIDGDGAVTLRDVTTALRAAVGLAPFPSGCHRKAADANGDGRASVADVVLLLRHIVLGIPLPG